MGHTTRTQIALLAMSHLRRWRRGFRSQGGPPAVAAQIDTPKPVC